MNGTESAEKQGRFREIPGRLLAAAGRYPLLCLFLAAVCANLLIESLARLSLFAGAAYLVGRPLSFLLNTLVLFLSFSVCLLFRRRLFVLGATAAGWLVLGITNAVVIVLRASPLSGIDFAILRSCLPIVKIYLRPWHVILILLFLGAVGWGVSLLFRRSRVYAVNPVREVPLFVFAAALSACGILLSVHTGAVETSFSDLPGAYRDYGFVTCFSLTVLERGIDEPENYSKPVLNALAASLGDPASAGDSPSATETAADKKRPNIVAVQLESFMDPERIAGAVYGESPAPFFRFLKERYPSGFLSVNTVGAGTANTEFEVLCGIDLTFFGAGEYPFQTVLKEEDTVCESMASALKSAGYTARAVHNHSASFYDRYKVYSALGFDGFVSLEYMNGTEDNPLGWAKDAVLTDVVRDCLDADENPDFVFAVSVQGHGLYPDRLDGGEPLFPAQAPAAWTEGEAVQLSYYAGQIREMDDFLRELTAMLEERAAETGEETLLLLYGDHLPPLPFAADSFADGSGPLDSEYVLVPVGDGLLAALSDVGDRDLEAWEAGMYILNLTGSGGLAGTGGGTILRCHREMSGSDSFKDALRLLSYDMLYGERYAWGGEKPFARQPLAMGLEPVLIRELLPAAGLLTVRGENFTAASVVSVNGWPAKTEFVSPEELTAEVAVTPGDRITVIQRTGDLIVLGETAPVSVPAPRAGEKER